MSLGGSLLWKRVSTLYNVISIRLRIISMTLQVLSSLSRFSVNMSAIDSLFFLSSTSILSVCVTILFWTYPFCISSLDLAPLRMVLKVTLSAIWFC